MAAVESLTSTFLQCNHTTGQVPAGECRAGTAGGACSCSNGEIPGSDLVMDTKRKASLLETLRGRAHSNGRIGGGKSRRL